jgi:hypothetical protein
MRWMRQCKPQDPDKDTGFFEMLDPEQRYDWIGKDAR